MIELNYKKPGAKYELYEKLENIIDFGEYENGSYSSAWCCIKKDESFAVSMVGFYDLYCDGYYFLIDLGLGYGLRLLFPHQNIKQSPGMS